MINKGPFKSLVCSLLGIMYSVESVRVKIKIAVGNCCGAPEMRTGSNEI